MDAFNDSKGERQTLERRTIGVTCFTRKRICILCRVKMTRMPLSGEFVYMLCKKLTGRVFVSYELTVNNLSGDNGG